jgi:3-hydroxy-9,10-secoandrosta-1,3,5(10)-triene-9,17-dione monooxygenase reductase component
MDPKNYKRVLSRYATGIAIIVTKIDKYSVNAITINSFSSISLNPPFISWSLDKYSSTYSNFQNIKSFDVYILSFRQKKISNFFSSNTQALFNSKVIKDLQKFSLAKLSCATIKKYTFGDHLFFLARVKKYKLNSNIRPLIYFSGTYK